MGFKSISSREREFDLTWTESLSINTEETNPHFSDARKMTQDRGLSTSLRRHLRMN